MDFDSNFLDDRNSWNITDVVLTKVSGDLKSL